MDFKHLIDNIPDYKVFLTVDEMDASSKKLAEDYPDIVTLWEAGKSRKGHPIYCMKIGEGSKNAFMFGSPHPNEPMGCMMLEYFTKYLCEHDDFRKNLIIRGTSSNASMLMEPSSTRVGSRDHLLYIITQRIGIAQSEASRPSGHFRSNIKITSGMPRFRKQRFSWI